MEKTGRRDEGFPEVNMLLGSDLGSSTTRGSERRDFPSCDFDLVKDDVERLMNVVN